MTLGGLAAAVGLVIDDAIVVVENIVMHRDAGQAAGEAIRSAIRRDPRAAGRLHHYAHRGVPAADFDHRRDRSIFPRAGGNGWHGAADLARPGADVDAHAEPLLHPQRGAPCRRRARERSHRGSCDSTSACCASRSSIPCCWRSSAVVLIGGFLPLLPQPGFGPAAADGRRRLHPGLHHAGRFLARGNQSCRLRGGAHSARDAGGRKHVAAYGAATRAGHRDRSQYGRHRGQAETRARPQRPKK